MNMREGRENERAQQHQAEEYRDCHEGNIVGIAPVHQVMLSRAISSAEERSVHTGEAKGSIPLPPTTSQYGKEISRIGKPAWLPRRLAGLCCEVNHGGCSSAGRAPGRGPGCRAFEPRQSPHGRLPKRPKGAVCKTVGVACAGSNPAPATSGPVAQWTERVPPEHETEGPIPSGTAVPSVPHSRAGSSSVSIPRRRHLLAVWPSGPGVRLQSALHEFDSRLRLDGPVAQGTELPSPKGQAGGSNPSRVADGAHAAEAATVRR